MALRIAVVGATGYAGAYCAGLLARHPAVDLVQVVARSEVGRPLDVVHPRTGVTLPIAAAVDPTDLDAIVSALPHGVGAADVAAWVAAGIVVLDLSADFRLRDPAAYQRWYGAAHPAPALLAEAVYALPELYPEAIRGARLLALPGCYPTAAILAVAPALRAGLVDPAVVVDAKSGVSGAGRSPTRGTHFVEVDESVQAYAVEGHRHLPEIEQELALAAGAPVAVTFVPHLVPMSRGLLATAYARLRPGVDAAALRAAYATALEGQPFWRLLDRPPATGWTVGTNHCWVHTAVQGGHAILSAAIDNLGKGAATQAVQALNLRFGLAPDLGLRDLGPMP